MNLRTCKKCDTTYEERKEYFRPRVMSDLSQGFHGSCKLCEAEYQLQYRMSKKHQDLTKPEEFKDIDIHTYDKLMYRAYRYIYSKAYGKVLSRYQFEQMELPDVI